METTNPYDPGDTAATLVRPYVANLGDTEVLPVPVPVPDDPIAPGPEPGAEGRPTGPTGSGHHRSGHRPAPRSRRSRLRGPRRRPKRTLTALLLGLTVLVALATASLLGRGPTPRPALSAIPPTAHAAGSPATPTPSATRSAVPTATTTPATTAPTSGYSAAARSTTGGDAYSDDGVLRQGDHGPAVAQLQQLLFDQGFTYVAVNGYYDAATVRGVTQLQQNRDLTGDPPGVYGPQTRASLTSDQ